MAQLFLCLVLGTESIQSIYAGDDPKNMSDFSETRKLLSRLNIDALGLEKVKKSANNPLLATRELLKYYRARGSVKHPIDRRSRADMLGKCAGKKDLETADNALKHIFVGQGSYPPHFCGDDIDWSTCPVRDKEWVWQLNRMGFWDSMGKAYWHTGDEKYAREWCAQLVDWTRKNRRDRKHGYAWRSIEAGIRGYRWTGLFQRYLDAPSFAPDVLVAFLNSCYEHAAFLMTRYSRGSNWSLMEAEGLEFIAILLPEFKNSEAWCKEAIRRMNKEIGNQVYSDGHQRELALGYHVGCIGWFMRTLELANMNNRKKAFPESYLQTIEKMCAVVMKLGFPDGRNPQFGDGWAGKPGGIWPGLRNWAELFGRKDFLYVATAGRKGTEPKATAFALKKSGFYSVRSSWDKNAIYLILKCGPDGGGHCQPDNGTFELYAGGRRLMPDSGCYIYHGDPKNRQWFRETRNHQTLTLNAKNSAYAPKLLLWRPGKDLDLLVVENASYKNLTHRRAVCFVDRKFFVIVDEAFGKATGNIDLHFQLAPGKAVFDNETFSVRTDFADGWNVLVKAVAQKGMKLEQEKGQVSFEYTKKEPRPAFRYRVHKETKEIGVRFVTLVAPYSGSQPKVSVQIKGQPEIGASRVDLDIVTGGISKRINYNLSKQVE